jgi:hypothetical protein
VGLTERTAQALLALGLEAIDSGAAPEEPVVEQPRGSLAAPDLLDGLLHRSLHQSTEDARGELFAALLRQLVPDEARILAALAGKSAPLVHVYGRGRGSAARPLLENASGVGRTAGLSLPDLAPTYVSRLLALGLVEIGDEDPALAVELEILMADPLVRAAIKDADALSRLPPRIVRGTLRLSALGAALWDGCHPAQTSPLATTG